MELREWLANSSVAPPTRPAAPSVGFPQGGVNPTKPGAYWYYQLEAEMRNLLTAAAVATDGAVLTQLRQSLMRLFSGNVTTVNAANSPFQLTADHAGLVVLDGTAGNIVANMPAANAVANKLEYRFTRSDAATNTATVNRAGSDTFVLVSSGGGATSFTLYGQGDFLGIAGDGVSKWNTVASPAPALAASGIQTFTATGTLPSSVVGGTAVINAAGATTQTLPAANAFRAGRRIEVFNIGAGVGTISRAGADTLTVGTSTVTSLPLGGGDSLTLETNGVNTWYAVGGTAQLKYAEAFKAGSNYAKLPNGLIVQWGHNNTFNGGTITLPVSFSGASSWVIAFAGWTLPVQPILTSKAAGSFVANGFGTTSGSTSSSATDWIAVGI